MLEHCAPVSSQLAVPRSRLKVFRYCAFSIAALGLWNAQPGSITECTSIGAFKRHIRLNLLLIRRVYFAVYLSCKAPVNGLLDWALYKCVIIIIIHDRSTSR